MDTLSNVLSGFSVVLDPINLFYVLVGVLVGMTIGALPGLGPAPAIALLLPMTYALEPETAIIMLAGIYYGAYYGGSVSAVILGIPGEASTIVVAYDGHEMARQGKAGSALGISAIASFTGGIVSLLGLIMLAPVIAGFARDMGPPEYAALASLGLILVAYLGRGSIARNVASACFGLVIATVGIDPISGSTRFTFGTTELMGGISFVAVAMGLFGIGEVLHNIENESKLGGSLSRVERVWPSKQDRRHARGAIARGSLLGFVLGIIPGGGAFMSSVSSYATEKKLSHRRREMPERPKIGDGAIEGVAGPEAANNAGSTSAFIPLLTLGIPSNLILALLFGALLIQGITPGPQLVNDHPGVFWGVIASMVVGNLILLLLALPFVRLFVQMVRIRMGILSALIVGILMLGVFSINNNIFDMWIVVGFGVFGYLLNKFGFDPGPMALAIVLGPLLENSFRQSMLMFDGSLVTFARQPLPGLVLVLVVLMLIYRVTNLVRSISNSRSTVDV